jgi:O-antigen chain-terminating methyltransferase
MQVHSPGKKFRIKDMCSRIKGFILFLKGLRGSMDNLHAQLFQILGRLERLLDRLERLEANHQASVEWMKQTYPEIVTAVGNKIEVEQLQQLSEQLFAAMYREVRSLKPDNAIQTDAAPAIPVRQASRNLDDRFYLDLEKRFRGSPAEIRSRLQPYLAIFQQNAMAAPVLDIGCGRGEWLQLLADAGMAAEGIDLNLINGAACRTAGLKVSTAAAQDFLARLPDASVGGVTAFQFIEHIEFDDLLALVAQIQRILQPGGILIMETPNPENILVASQTFWIDPTHRRPLPPELIEFVVLQKGLQPMQTLRLNPHENYLGGEDRLDKLLYGPRDYAVVARKPLT